MDLKRFFRILVCFVLVCALVVQVSPIKVKATAAVGPLVGGIVGVVALDIFQAMLIGQGISEGVSSTDFDALTDELVDYYTKQGVIDSDGLMNLYYLDNGVYGVDATLLQGLLDWVWDNEVVTSTAPYVGTSFSYSYDGTYQTCSASVPVVIYGCNFHVIEATRTYTNMGVYAVGESLGNFCANTNYTAYTYSLSKVASGAYVFRFVNGSATLYPEKFSNVTYLEFTGSSFTDCEQQFYSSVSISEGEISTTSDLTVGEVAAAGSTLADGYPTWAANAVSGTDGDGNDIVVYPIGTASLGDEELVYTQEEVQAGTVPLVVVKTETDTDTESGAGTGTVEPTPEVTPDTDALTQAGFDASMALFLYDLGAMIGAWFEEQFGVLSAICDWVESIYGYVERIAEGVASIFTAFEPLLEWIEALVTGQTTIIDSIVALPGVLGEVMATVIAEALTLVFAPSEIFIATKVEALTLKFPWLDSMIAMGDNFKSFFNGLGTTPPIIYIDLGAGSGWYPMGSKEVFLDLTWYSQYKGTVDGVLSAFMWLWFGWRLFLTLPSIINGTSGSVGSIASWSERYEKVQSGPPSKK